MRRELDKLDGGQHDARAQTLLPRTGLVSKATQDKQTPGGMRSRPRGRPVERNRISAFSRFAHRIG